MDFTHFIITRYNVRLEGWGWDHDLSGGATLDHSWLRHRYNLFMKYCVPSVIVQTSSGFQWLIYISPDTPLDYVQKFNTLASQYSHFSFRAVQGHEECMVDIRRTLASAKTPYVITTRLDNDDGLGKDYVANVQAHFVREDKIILNFLQGHGYDVNRSVFTSMHHMRMNHFTSLIEARSPDGSNISVRGFAHDDPPADMKFINLDNKHAWLKIFHERNLKSALFGYPVFQNKLHHSYGLAAEDLHINIGNTWAYAALWLADGIKRKIFRTKKKIIARKAL
jgi:hypothetical protein